MGLSRFGCMPGGGVMVGGAAVGCCIMIGALLPGNTAPSMGTTGPVAAGAGPGTKVGAEGIEGAMIAGWKDEAPWLQLQSGPPPPCMLMTEPGA